MGVKSVKPAGSDTKFSRWPCLNSNQKTKPNIIAISILCIGTSSGIFFLIMAASGGIITFKYPNQVIHIGYKAISGTALKAFRIGVPSILGVSFLA